MTLIIQRFGPSWALSWRCSPQECQVDKFGACRLAPFLETPIEQPSRLADRRSYCNTDFYLGPHPCAYIGGGMFRMKGGVHPGSESEFSHVSGTRYADDTDASQRTSLSHGEY